MELGLLDTFQIVQADCVAVVAIEVCPLIVMLHQS